jgi:hypothetical protein
MRGNLTPKQIKKYGDILLKLLSPTGAAIGNMNARNQLQKRVMDLCQVNITVDDYWDIRDALYADDKIGVGRGKGGAIYRVTNAQQAVTPLGNLYGNERDLYEPVRKTVEGSLVKLYRIETFVSEITSNLGRRNTGGQWTRPDIALCSVTAYPFIPGKSIELITFEIKPMGMFQVTGVFETASHSVFAHRSYLMIHVPKDYNDSSVLDRLDRESDRFGVGFYTFEDPTDWDTYENRVEARRQAPDPSYTSDFIKSQMLKTKGQIDLMIK